MSVSLWEPAQAPGQRQPLRNALRALCRALPLLGLALVGVMAVGCGRAQNAAPETQDGFTVTFATEPAAPAVGEGTVVVTLADASGHPVDNAQLAVEANMSHAGMTPVNAAATGSQDGVYRVPLAWTMSGDWFVDVQFTLPDSQVVARRFPVNVR